MESNRSMFFYNNQNGDLFKIGRKEFEAIKMASIDQLAVYLLDENPLIRLVAQQKLTLLKKEEVRLCSPLNPSKNL